MKIRKCGNCANAECQDGEYFCEIDGNHVDPECCPRLYDGFCWSKREKQEKTPEEISAMRSEFGRRGGLARAKSYEKRCVRCASCVKKNGVKTCSRDGAVVSDEDRARFDDGKCWTKIVPKKKTPEEISAMRSEFGRIGGLALAKSRKKLSRSQIRVYTMDRAVLLEYGKMNGMKIVGVIHSVCCAILQNHPDINKPDGWVD